jgi:hypothetical protein
VGPNIRVGAVGIGLIATLIIRKLLILLNAKNAKNTGFAQPRYTAGTRRADSFNEVAPLCWPRGPIGAALDPASDGARIIQNSIPLAGFGLAARISALDAYRPAAAHQPIQNCRHQWPGDSYCDSHESEAMPSLVLSLVLKKPSFRATQTQRWCRPKSRLFLRRQQ